MTRRKREKKVEEVVEKPKMVLTDEPRRSTRERKPVIVEPPPQANVTVAVEKPRNFGGIEGKYTPLSEPWKHGAEVYGPMVGVGASKQAIETAGLYRGVSLGNRNQFHASNPRFHHHHSNHSNQAIDK